MGLDSTLRRLTAEHTLFCLFGRKKYCKGKKKKKKKEYGKETRRATQKHTVNDTTEAKGQITWKRSKLEGVWAVDWAPQASTCV